MNDECETGTRAVRTALFVDFDNVFISLQEVSPSAAAAFATRPAEWLSWFAAGNHTTGVPDGACPQPRSLLVRRCYLNPVKFGKFRSHFTRAAFSVVDCPPLTARGKNSADIYMVMDIIDALEHNTRFEEFIILSADADFTPVLLRLRAYDRRTTILANELAVPAYRAACDYVVDLDVFVENALGNADDEAHVKATVGVLEYASLIARAADLVYDLVADQRSVDAADLPKLFAACPEFKNSNWFGCHSLRKLTEKIIELRPELGARGDWSVSWSIALKEDAASAAPREHSDSSESVPALRRGIVDFVKEKLAGADAPIQMPPLAHAVIQTFGPQVKQTAWAGAGSFKSLIAAEAPDDIGILNLAPGYVYDPHRHDVSAPPDSARNDNRGGIPIDPDLRSLTSRVSDVTGAPALPPQDYAVIFSAIADAVGQGYRQRNELSRIVRDLCVDRGHGIGRNSINFVLTGLYYSGVNLSASDLTARGLAEGFLDNVLALCENARLDLSEADLAAVDRWLLGNVPAMEAGAVEAEATVAEQRDSRTSADCRSPGRGPRLFAARGPVHGPPTSRALRLHPRRPRGRLRRRRRPRRARVAGAGRRAAGVRPDQGRLGAHALRTAPVRPLRRRVRRTASGRPSMAASPRAISAMPAKWRGSSRSPGTIVPKSSALTGVRKVTRSRLVAPAAARRRKYMA